MMKYDLQFFGGRGASGGGPSASSSSSGEGPKLSNGKPAVVNGNKIQEIQYLSLDEKGNEVSVTEYELSSNNGFWDGYETYNTYEEAVKAAKADGGTIVNGNKVSNVDGDWVVESADGSWDGYETYSTKKEAMKAARS